MLKPIDFTSYFSASTDFPKFSHEDTCLFLGSCFSEHISTHMNQAGFEVLSNPFGTVFHPFPIADSINWALEKVDFSDHFFEHSGLFYHWKASNLVNASSKEVLIDLLAEKRTALKSYLEKSKVLFLSFGSSYGYQHQMFQDNVVANCHKKPKKEFLKLISTHSELCAYYSEMIENLKTMNPKLNVVLTVSPVRYYRDGLTEDRLSKSNLISFCHEMSLKSNVHYFPSYELITDLLRDYRYFELDGAHPSKLAINEVWKMFQSWFFEAKTLEKVKEGEDLRKLFAHKILNENAHDSIVFIKNRAKKLSEFLMINKNFHW